ncbi:MAG TPA: hypothetical protein VGM53_35330 [Streptosporangiaceae bacterium]|jgi:hypothetical protein
MGRIDEAAANREHADSYIGAANYSGHDDPRIQVGLAQAEAFLVIASAIDRLSDTIREVFQPAVQPVPSYEETLPPYDQG